MAAGIDYDTIKKRSHQVWTPEKILGQLNDLRMQHPKLRSSTIQKSDKKLYHATIRNYKSFSNAMAEVEKLYGTAGESRNSTPKYQEGSITQHPQNPTNDQITSKPKESRESRESREPIESKGTIEQTRTQKSKNPINPINQINPKNPSKPRNTNVSNPVLNEPDEPKKFKSPNSPNPNTHITPGTPQVPASKPLEPKFKESAIKMESNDKPSGEMKIFTVRTRVRSERNVGETIVKRAEKEDITIGNIQYPSLLNGYIFVECDDREVLNRIIKTIRNAQGLLNGETTHDEITKYMKSTRSKKSITEGAKIEITDGQFKGERAIIQHVNDRTKEITVELMDELFKMPIKISKNNCKLI
jgi:transcription elongation factor Spt5